MTLNADQQKAGQHVLDWWRSNEPYFILEGRAGTGKTFLLKQLIETLPCVKPIVTAPTNEATRQLELAIGSKEYDIQTTYKALNYGFDTSKEKKEFKQLQFPQHLEDYNLLVVDEVSFVGADVLESIKQARIKTLFLGHRNQLPEVVTKVSLFDRYDPVVFKQDYPIYVLNTPVRNTGEIYHFCNDLESLIDSNKKIVKTSFDIGRSGYEKVINHSTDDFLEDNLHVIGWTNKEVNEVNKQVRRNIFGPVECEKPFKPTDNIILTKPSSYIGDIEKVNGTVDSRCNKLFRLQKDSITLTTNTKLVVQEVQYVDFLDVLCLKLTALDKLNNQVVKLYVPDKEDLSRLYKTLLYAAYGVKSDSARKKAFQRLHFIMSLFAHVNFSYALTVYRSQGMSIPKVIVRLDDINKCKNVFLKHKMLYVAASRAMDTLGIVR